MCIHVGSRDRRNTALCIWNTMIPPKDSHFLSTQNAWYHSDLLAEVCGYEVADYVRL